MQRLSFLIFFTIFTFEYKIIHAKAIQNDEIIPLKNHTEDLNSLLHDGIEEKRLKKRQTEADTIKCNEVRNNCLRNCKNDSECTKKCYTCPELKIIVENDVESYDHGTSTIHSGSNRNVATVIKLTNLINNTNLIDIPTNVNSTNLNHIHLYQNRSSNEGGKYGLGYTKDGSCCFVVQPRVCTTSSRGYRCHHRRHKTCGQQCTSRVIHSISRSKCTSHHNCHHNIAYIGQPQRPKCIYISTWPYVSCGGNYKQACSGCYDHYGYGVEAYYGSHGIPSYCSACYDEGFDTGPLYRKGPIFRPFYYHQPPCYFYGNCFPMMMMMMPLPSCNMFGCYGHQYVDPVWGMTNQHHIMSSSHYSHDDDYDVGDQYFNDYTESNDIAPIESDDWGIQLQKCLVVQPDGTKLFKNCTVNTNSYAASPVHDVSNISPISNDWSEKTLYTNDYYGTDSNDAKIHKKRHTKMNHRRRHQLIYDDD